MSLRLLLRLQQRLLSVNCTSLFWCALVAGLTPLVGRSNCTPPACRIASPRSPGRPRWDDRDRDRDRDRDWRQAPDRRDDRYERELPRRDERDPPRRDDLPRRDDPPRRDERDNDRDRYHDERGGNGTSQSERGSTRSLSHPARPARSPARSWGSERERGRGGREVARR